MARNKFGGGMPGNMNNMMKQFEKMQKEMEKAQLEMDERIFETTAGGGAVKVLMNGKKELVELHIDKDIVDPDDVEMLQDLIIACVNAASQDVEDMQNKKVSELTGGMNIPGL